MIVYPMLRSFLRTVASVFFRQIEVVGLENVPAEGEGPVIFAGNHPNSLIDPVLIVGYSGRVVRFAAKDVLFKSRLLAPILNALGAVPVARKTDHEGKALDNDAAFTALTAVLARGEAMGIFPEGLSHDDSQLKRLKTGAARIAFDAATKHPDIRIRVVPSGLTYIHPKRFASRVLLQFGAPIEVDAPWLARFEKEPREAVQALTQTIETALRSLTVNAADWDTLVVLDGVRRIYQPANIAMEDRVTLARRFNDVYPSVKDEPEVVAIYDRVKAYNERLRAADLTDRDLRREVRPGEALGKLLRHLVLLFVWLPLALPGLVLHAPIGILAAWAGQTLTPRKDVVATTKLVAGLLGVLLLYAAVVVAAAWFYGPLAALGAAALLPLTGAATLRVLQRSAAVRRVLSTLVRLFSLRHEMDALRKERAALEVVVVQAVDRFRPADMVPMFPRSVSVAKDVAS